MTKSILKNDNVEIEVSSHGAELYSLFDRKNQVEYIWQGDKKYWAWHAPICFPITGRVKDDKYRFKDHEYKLTVHGFARDCEFDLLKKTENSLIYELKSNENTLKLYPFKFSLKLIYQLLDNGLKVNYVVENLDEQDIFFSLGLHTAYNCPFILDNNCEDYELIFEENETIDRWFMKNGIITGFSERILNNTNTLLLTKDLFAKDIILMQKPKSKYVVLKDKRSEKDLKISFENFMNLGIWSKPEGAPFVCIEPWTGLADIEGKEVDFSKKAGNYRLSPHEVFECNYQIEIK